MNAERSLTYLRRASRWIAAMAGVVIAATAPVAARSISAAQAPAEWVAYAEGATSSITGWLQANSDAAVRLRAYLDATRPAPDQPTAPLLVKVWIDPEGTISRIDHPPFAHAKANADLHGLIVGRRLPDTPPEDILLPLRIAVQLDARAGFRTGSRSTAAGRDPRKLT